VKFIFDRIDHFFNYIFNLPLADRGELSPDYGLNALHGLPVAFEKGISYLPDPEHIYANLGWKIYGLRDQAKADDPIRT